VLKQTLDNGPFGANNSRKALIEANSSKQLPALANANFDELPITVTNTGLPIVVQPFESSDN